MKRRLFSARKDDKNLNRGGGPFEVKEFEKISHAPL